MVKECPVILNNELVTVVKYGEIDVQFPSIKKKAKTIFVQFKDGEYTIVDELPKETAIKPTRKRKKTTDKNEEENLEE